MKKKLLNISFIFLFGITTVYANSTFSLNIDNIFNETKEETIKQSLNNNLTFQFKETIQENDEDIIQLSKKITYLILSSNDSKTPTEYYNKFKTFQNLGHENSSIKSLQEKYKKLEELNIKYNYIDNVQILKKDDDYISMVNLKNITSNDTTTDLFIYYHFKKQDNKYKLYNLTYEFSLDIINFYNEKTNNIYNSSLKELTNKITYIDNAKAKNIALNNSKNIVTISSYNNGALIDYTNGFFIKSNIIITSLSHIEKSLREGQNLLITNSGKNIDFEILEIIPEKNIALIKTTTENTFVTIDENYKIDDSVLLVGKLNETTINTLGQIISIDNKINLVLPAITNIEGSPIFNEEGKVIGMINNTENSSLSSSLLAEDLKEIEQKITSNLNTLSFNELKNKYYYIKTNEEKVELNINSKKWEQIKKIGDIENTIKLKLIRTSSKDEINIIKYYNESYKYINSIKYAEDFINNLKNSGYIEVLKTTNKYIYENINNKIIIFGDYDYLIIVLVKK